MAKPKRNKLSQRRLDKKRKQIEGMQHQRYKAWMLHEMIDKDLLNLRSNPITERVKDKIPEKEKEKQ